MDPPYGRRVENCTGTQRITGISLSRLKSRTKQRDTRPRRAYIKSVASVHKTWRERGEFRLDQLFHGRASALRGLGILLSMSSNVTWSTSWSSVSPGTREQTCVRCSLRCTLCVNRCAPTAVYYADAAINALMHPYTFALCNRCTRDRTRVLARDVTRETLYACTWVCSVHLQGVHGLRNFREKLEVSGRTNCFRDVQRVNSLDTIRWTDYEHESGSVDIN